MCGVYGFCGKPDKNTPRIFRYLGFLNESRGKDSTGFYAYSPDEESFIKDAEKATKFYSKFAVMKQLVKYADKSYLMLIGHTRAATVGAVSKDNAHPFRIGKIVMTHNGHISNFGKLQNELKSKYEVDSQIIGHLLSKHNDRAAFNQLEGWFTVPYIDSKRPDILSIGTSNGMFAYAIRKDQVYYSSNSYHLKDALKGQSGFSFFEGDKNLIYRFYMLNKFMAVSEEPIRQAEIALLPATVCSINSSLTKTL